MAIKKHGARSRQGRSTVSGCKRRHVLAPRQYLKGSQSMQNIPGTDPAAFLSYALVTELIDTLMSQGVMSSVEVNNMLHRILSTIGTINRGASNEAADILREWIKRNPAK